LKPIKTFTRNISFANTTKASYNPFFSSTQVNDPKQAYKMKIGGKDEDISWLLG